jgi:hypothetical protein
MSLTKASYSMITGAPVNVMDYGAKCDGVTDDTAAVQAAVTYASANEKDLYIPGMCLLTSSVNINRVVGVGEVKSYFNIFSDGGGGFTVNTAINMFSSTLTYVGSFAPVSQLINFQNLKFTTNNLEPALSGANVLNGLKFLRTKFTQCNFYGINCLNTLDYIQSIHFYECNARFWKGDFLKAVVAYDLQVIGGLYEGGLGNCFNVIRPTGCKFYTIIEGLTGTALLLNASQGVDISCYFESNLCDFDCSDGNFLNYGVNLHGCFTAQPTGPYAFKWGPGTGMVASGNVMAGPGTMHYLPYGNATTVAINDFAQSPGVLSSQIAIAPNNGIRQQSFSGLNIRGGSSSTYTTSNITCHIQTEGRICTINFQATVTPTANHASPDTLYISNSFPNAAAFEYAPCGNVYVNNNIYPCFITTNTSPNMITVANAIPANTSGVAFLVTGSFQYLIAPV